MLESIKNLEEKIYEVFDKEDIPYMNKSVNYEDAADDYFRLTFIFCPKEFQEKYNLLEKAVRDIYSNKNYRINVNAGSDVYFYKTKITVNKDQGWINLGIDRGRDITIDNKGVKYYSPNYSEVCKIYHYLGSSKVFYKTPLTLKMISSRMAHLSKPIQEFLFSFLDSIIDETSTSKKLFRDLKDELISGRLLVPIKFDVFLENEIGSKKALIEKSYKVKYYIPKSVNKRPLYDTYYKMQILNKVKESEHNKIWNWTLSDATIEKYFGDSLKNKSDKCKCVYERYLIDNNDVLSLNKISPSIKRLLTKKLGMSEYLSDGATEDEIDFLNENISMEMKQILEDTVRMIYDIEKYFNLNISSFSKLYERHDQLIYAYLAKANKGSLIIPKDSGFEKLELPKKYELIKTTRRLNAESKIQQHCVASYKDKINKGVCVIYSTIYEGDRYTIEIRKKKVRKGKVVFYASQIQGKRNVKVIPCELREELNQLLSQCNEG